MSLNKSDTLLLTRLLDTHISLNDDPTDYLLDSGTMETKNLCVKVSPAFVDVVEEYSSRLGITKSAFVREALAAHIERTDIFFDTYVAPHLNGGGKDA